MTINYSSIDDILRDTRVLSIEQDKFFNGTDYIKLTIDENTSFTTAMQIANETSKLYKHLDKLKIGATVQFRFNVPSLGLNQTFTVRHDYQNKELIQGRLNGLVDDFRNSYTPDK